MQLADAGTKVIRQKANTFNSSSFASHSPVYFLNICAEIWKRLKWAFGNIPPLEYNVLISH